MNINPHENLAPQERSSDNSLEKSLGTELGELLHNPHLMQNPKEMLGKLENLQERMNASGIDTDGMRLVKQILKERISEYDRLDKGII